MIKLGTVCTGIGALEQGVENLNIEHEIVFGCEIDQYAKKTYLANFKPKTMLSDMTKESWEGEEMYSDLFMGGIPCQSFSLAGKRLGELDPRGLLFYDFYKYVKIQNPKVFIIENVKGLLSDANGTTFQNWVHLLGRSLNTQEQMFPHPDSLLYNLHVTVLNSKDFGVPQNRERVFVVGIRNDLPNTFRFPVGFRLEKRLKDILEPVVHEKYYLSETILKWIDLHREKRQSSGKYPYNENDISGCLTARYHKMGAEDIYIQEPHCIAMHGRGERGEILQQFEKRSDGITNTITRVQKDNLVCEPELKQVHQLDGFESEGRVYDADGISRTIKFGGGGGAKTGWYEVKEATKKGFAIASEGDSINLSNINSETRRGRVGNQIANTLDVQCNQSVVTKSRIRRLTPLECMRLQGFPDSFIKPVSDTQIYKQAGNSITVSVIQAIVKNLLPILE